MNIITDARCTEYCAEGHPESPRRVQATLAALQADPALGVTWHEPLPVADETLLLAHTPEHLARLNLAVDFDADTPAHPQIAAHARRSVGGALKALQLARGGQTAFSLLRPPGHHANQDTAMGFCYLNSIAIAALAASQAGMPRVAVFDFDVHHGNGTEDILFDKPGLAFLSVHQFPCYPGTGKRDRGNNCFNFTVRPGSPREVYRETLEKALGKLGDWKPDLVAVSAGFDAYSRDPLAEGSLEAEDFHWIGQKLRGLSVPFFSILEGGYSMELPELVLAYLKGTTEG